MPSRRDSTRPASRSTLRWCEIVGCERSNASFRSQTQHSSHAASRFTIATRVGSASARKRAASSSLSASSSGRVPGPQQRIGKVALAFIDECQYTLSTYIDARRSHERLPTRQRLLRRRRLLLTRVRPATWSRRDQVAVSNVEADVQHVAV